ncbi:Transcriptional regulatory protein WalR [Gammaproteobacteria bacterium]
MSYIPTKVLIVEDDSAMRECLRHNLEAEGYQALLASGTREARRQIREGRPDLILLDLMLPDGDGINLCRTLREEGLRQPVIMLSARGEEVDKVLGLEVGADDYVVKPFGLRELLARVRAHLRRAGVTPRGDGLYTVGVAQVDFSRHLLLRDGQVQEISARELELLRYLNGHRGQVLSRERLLSEVWGHRADIVTRTVDNFIVRLRRHIEPDPSVPHYLITIHGRGYKLVEH